MKELGPAAGEDPTILAPLANWKPIPERMWAIDYLDDYEGFRAAFRQHYPHLFRLGYDTYMPPSADHYIRRTAENRRVDIDWELMNLKKSDEDLAREKQIREAAMRKRREALLSSREGTAHQDPPEEEQPQPVKLDGRTKEGRAQRDRKQNEIGSSVLEEMDSE